MGIVYVAFDSDYVILAQGGYRNIASWFFLALDELNAIANYMGGTLVLVRLDEDAWNAYQRNPDIILDKQIPISVGGLINNEVV